MSKTIIVVPCYNEAERLDVERFAGYAETHPDTAFVCVDDGSTDETGAALQRLRTRNPRQFAVIDLERNAGKAEAVRRGVLAALEREPAFVGYWDADLATPLEEIARFERALADDAELLVVMGARVKLLGRSVRRSALRHYLGRVFATLASWTLGLAVYDTQCGAKLLRATPLARELFAEPFLSGWIFDVEVLARLVAHYRRTGAADPERVVRELPLMQWHDIAGSKVGPLQGFGALRDLARLYRRYLS